MSNSGIAIPIWCTKIQAVLENMQAFHRSMAANLAKGAIFPLPITQMLFIPRLQALDDIIVTAQSFKEKLKFATSLRKVHFASALDKVVLKAHALKAMINKCFTKFKNTATPTGHVAT